MPYTLPLLEVPPFPTAQSKVANADGTPTKEWVTFLSNLEAYLERVQAALVELELP